MADAFEGARVFVTGATGLIGAALCRRLDASGARVVALVRDAAKAAARLPPGVETVVGDMTEPYRCSGGVDYLVHGAGPTASRAFAEAPVETIETIVDGARRAIEFAREKRVRGAVLLSTMEVYGLTDSESVDEAGYAALDTMSPRSCYPEAKRLAECLFASAAKEHGVPAKVARLTQTFGAGVAADDMRVFAQFARAAAAGRDIVLASDGATARCYCSTDDAVEGILAVLARGEPGAAYNVANPDTFCTVREMAEMVAREFSGGRSRVVAGAGGAEGRGYLPPFRMKLDVRRLEALGWRPRKGLRQMFSELTGGTEWKREDAAS